MPRNPLFSSYRQGENRVTSSIMAVFERIDLALLEAILASASGESSLQMVSFVNQPPATGKSIPDACISAQFVYWFEAKTVRGAVKEEQLKEHLNNLTGDAGNEYLFVITPDAEQPRVSLLRDPRVIWFNFQSLYSAIDAATNDPAETISDQALYLLRELQAFLLNEGLVDTDEVVVVAARVAYSEYLERGSYVCQPGRPFRDGVTHIGFYADSAIQKYIPKIEHQEDFILFTRDEAISRKEGTAHDQAIGTIIEGDLASGRREDGERYKVFLLTKVGDADTEELSNAIKNDTVAVSGRPWAWTQSQRYVSIRSLKKPEIKFTSQLE
jgi:hypothetical protein